MGDRRQPDPNLVFFLAHDLGGPGHWAETVSVQMGRVVEAARDVRRDPTPANHHRLHYESYFFLAGVRQLLRVCDALARVTDDARLKDARTTFEAAVSDAINFRNWLEHLDAYFSGVGHMQKSGDVSGDATLSIESEDDWIALHFDGRKLDLLATSDAAKDLAAVASDVWTEYAIRRRGPEWGTILRHPWQP